MNALHEAQERAFWNGTLAAALKLLASKTDDMLAASVFLEAASKLEWAAKEMTRRDENERRNCVNWGPCSRHDGRMGDGESEC